MKENNLDVPIGDDTLNEIHNTIFTEVPYIKILSNNRFWCIVCCKTGVSSIDSKKSYLR